MSNKKILIVAESIDVNDSSASKGRVALINNLMACDYELKVYHFTRKAIQLEGIESIAIKEKKFNYLYLLSKIQLVFYRLFKIYIGTSFEKIIGFSCSYLNDVKSIRSALKKEHEFDPDWVLTLSKAASFRTHMALLKIPKWHAKWLAYVHDPFPHHFYPRPYNWVEPGFYQKQEFFREVSKKCAFALFPSLLLKEWMGSYYPDFLQRGHIIPHQIEKNDLAIESLPDFFKVDGFTVLHSGNLMKPRDPKGLVEGFKVFLSRCEDAKMDAQLLLLGPHDYFAIYLQSMSQQLEQLYISDGYVDYNVVRTLQNSAAVNVILEAKAEISPFLPGKFPHCVVADKPILHLGPKLSESLRLLGEDYTFTAEIDDVNQIASHLEVLYHNWKSQNKDSRLNRQDLVLYMSAGKLKDVIDQLES